jgi:hypothetical protein
VTAGCRRPISGCWCRCRPRRRLPITWEALRLSGTDALAVRASKKLRTDELYLTSFAPTRLRMELDRCRSGAAIMWP